MVHTSQSSSSVAMTLLSVEKISRASVPLRCTILGVHFIFPFIPLKSKDVTRRDVVKFGGEDSFGPGLPGFVVKFRCVFCSIVEVNQSKLIRTSNRIRTIRTVLSTSCRGKNLRLVVQWDRHIELLKITDAMDAISSAKNLSVTFFEIEIRAKVVHLRRLCHLGRMRFSMTTAIRSFCSARAQRQASWNFESFEFWAKRQTWIWYFW